MARARSAKGADAFLPSPDTSRVQSLGGGRWVRVFDHRGKGQHVPLPSRELDELVAEVEAESPELATRITRELRQLGWAPAPSPAEADPELDPEPVE